MRFKLEAYSLQEEIPIGTKVKFRSLPIQPIRFGIVVSKWNYFDEDMTEGCYARVISEGSTRNVYNDSVYKIDQKTRVFFWRHDFPRALDYSNHHEILINGELEPIYYRSKEDMITIIGGPQEDSIIYQNTIFKRKKFYDRKFRPIFDPWTRDYLRNVMREWNINPYTLKPYKRPRK